VGRHRQLGQRQAGFKGGLYVSVYFFYRFRRRNFDDNFYPAVLLVKLTFVNDAILVFAILRSTGRRTVRKTYRASGFRN
jgi:hypothetical protein